MVSVAEALTRSPDSYLVVSLGRHWNSVYYYSRAQLPTSRDSDQCLIADGLYIETGEIDTVRQSRSDGTYNWRIAISANNEVRLSDFATWLRLCSNGRYPILNKLRNPSKNGSRE